MRRLDPDKAVRDLGRRVAELRVSRGWTQEQFAERCELSTRYIQAIERGSQNLSVRSITRLANVFRVPLAEFFLPPTKPAPRRGRPVRRKPKPRS